MVKLPVLEMGSFRKEMRYYAQSREVCACMIHWLFIHCIASSHIARALQTPYSETK